MRFTSVHFVALSSDGRSALSGGSDRIVRLWDVESKKEVRLVIELSKDAIPQVVLNNLFKHTQLQDNFPVNMLALVDGLQPRVLNIQQILGHYIDHQIEVVTNRTKYRLRKAQERAHVLEGLLIALNNLDAVIALIRNSASVDEAREGLIAQFHLS